MYVCVHVVWSRYVHTVCTWGTGVYVCTICIELVPIHDFLPIHQIEVIQEVIL